MKNLPIENDILGDISQKSTKGINNQDLYSNTNINQSLSCMIQAITSDLTHKITCPHLLVTIK